MTNCYIVGCPETKEGAIIDPGGDGSLILKAVEKLGLTIRYVINTHGHFDHILANKEVVEGTGGRLAIHPADAPMLALDGGAAWFGLEADPSPPPDVELHEGDVLTVGQVRLQVLHTPGHSPGSVSLYCSEEGVIFDGDVLFHMGIGRTDLPGGDYPTLIRSIHRLLALPEETRVLSGHGPETTIGYEKQHNPWL